VPSTLITLAPTGAETAKVEAPALPVTRAELVSVAKAAEAAGAAMIHVHVRDDSGEPTLDPGIVAGAVRALREQCGLVVQVSSGGAVSDGEEARLAVLDCGPEMASLTMGTLNFGDEVFTNRWPFIVELHTRMRDRGIVAEYECFDLGHVAALHRLLEREGPPAGGHVHVDLVMGVPGGMPATTASLVAAVAALPAGATFSATGVGRASLPVALASLSAGGHLRVGMEDCLTFAPGEVVRDNVQLVDRAASLAALAQRPAMTPDEARAMLGLPSRS
jgi:3-keto-5-aminohexanoate cleavage enzyme